MKNSCQITYRIQHFLAAIVLTHLLFWTVGLDVAAADSLGHSEGVVKENIMRHSLAVTNVNPSGENRLPLAIAQSAAPKAIAGISQDLSNLMENLMAQLSETIAKEPPQNGNLPDSVANAVLQDASKRSNLPRKELRVVKAKPRDWPDGCLGLAAADSFCTQIVVSGWEVMVADKERSFLYRTNDSGSLVKISSEID